MYKRYRFITRAVFLKVLELERLQTTKMTSIGFKVIRGYFQSIDRIQELVVLRCFATELKRTEKQAETKKHT